MKIMELKTKFKRKSIIIAAILLVLFVFSWSVIGILLTKINEQEQQMDRLNMAHDQLDDIIAAQLSEADTYKKRELLLNGEIDELGTNLSIQEWDKVMMEEFIIKNNVSMDFNEDDRATTRFLPRQVIAKLETLIEAVSTGDKDLYLSTLRYPTAYMLYPFENRKGTVYTIKEISPYGNDINMLQRGGYFVALTIVDDKGNEDLIPAIGMMRDFDTGEWVIYDFD